MMQVLFLKTHVSGYTRADGVVVAPHEDQRAAALPEGYAIEHKKLMWNEPAMHHVYHKDRPHSPVASKYKEDDAIAAAHAHMQANQPKPEVSTPKKAVAAKKKPKMEFDEKSGLHFPASGVEPIVEFHNTNEKNGFKIEPSSPNGTRVDFGGIFSGPRAGMSGDYMHAVILDPDHHMEHGDLHNESWSKVDAAIKKIKPGLSKQERENLYDYLSEDKEAGDLWDSDDRLAYKFFGGSDAGEASWNAQAMRGKLAFALGYRSVDMKDETGTSTLVAPGHVTHPLKEGESFNAASARIQDAWEAWKARKFGTMAKSIVVFHKAHPVQQAMSRAATPADLNEAGFRRNPGEPDAAQAESSEYNKPRIQWRGLTIAIENPAGSVRRGRNRAGVTWEVRMRFDYGEVLGTLGVDGDPVDVIMGPNLDAPTVYVVHQRRYNDWDNYDEDKCCIGFDSQTDAEQAFLSNYNDPRFLGPITAMLVDEFVAKVRATKEKPAMIKSILFFKAHVGAYLRGGKMVNLNGYQGRTARAVAGPGQLSLFGSNKPLNGKDAVAHTPDLFDEPQHTEPTRELVAEHERLVDVLRSPSHEDDKAEAKKQAGELAELKGEAKPAPKPQPTEAEFAEGWSGMTEKRRLDAIQNAAPSMSQTSGKPSAAAKRLAAGDWGSLPDGIKEKSRLDVRIFLKEKQKHAERVQARTEAAKVSMPVTEAPKRPDPVGHKDSHNIGGLQFTARRIETPRPHWRAVIDETGQVIESWSASTRAELWDKLGRDFQAIGADRWRASLGVASAPLTKSIIFLHHP